MKVELNEKELHFLVKLIDLHAPFGYTRNKEQLLIEKLLDAMDSVEESSYEQ